MDVRTAFPSKYLKAADLGKARPVVQMDRVEMVEIGDERLPVLSFIGKDKGLILNRTNSNMIEEIAGTFETDSWRGVRIQLYATKTDYAGKRVDCVRVEAPTTVAVPPPAPVAPPVFAAPATGEIDADEIPF